MPLLTCPSLKEIFFSLLLFGLSFLMVGRVAAQETTTTTTTETTTTITETTVTEPGSATSSGQSGSMSPTPYPVDTVFTKPRQTEEIKRLRSLYQEQVEVYREFEKQYYIDVAQFKQLNTLQSLEKAIVSTREVMLARADVLITYYELVRASIEETEGIELSKKQQVIDESISHINKLKLHKQAVAETVDRDGINNRSDEFNLLQKEFEPTAHMAIALIVSGDIQTIYDKSYLIYQDILTLHEENPVGALRQAERDRAYTQVDRLYEQVGDDLREVRNTVASNGRVTRSTYSSSFGKDLETSYTGTSQLLSYLKELIVEMTD